MGGQDPDSSARVLVGRVRRPHGLRGELVVEVLSDLPERFAAGAALEAVTRDGRRRTVEIAGSRPHAGTLLLSFAGIEDRDAAESLRGAILEIGRAASPPAPPGAYYFFELVGCRCVDAAAGELGRVAEVIEDGGGLLLRVVAERRELLVPFVSAYLETVDREAGEIRLRLPEGLIEACESTS